MCFCMSVRLAFVALAIASLIVARLLRETFRKYPQSTYPAGVILGMAVGVALMAFAGVPFSDIKEFAYKQSGVATSCLAVAVAVRHIKLNVAAIRARHHRI